MKIINTNKAPKAIWPYSQGIDLWNLVFLSGQIAIDPDTEEFIAWNIETQTKRIIENISGVLAEIWLDISNVVKATIYITNIDDFWKVNEIYGEYFSHKPARSTIGVSRLPKDALIEIEVIASR